ncbi:hypothetical protein DID77_02665 [Candidatus Marinamargulisbacteria bacterium SCGC AG-439-L15]|nr:hypothetical protein DID77_02665 [Candidatus Marinamargulisbacteria bacterium SCGC AG-439-L15]
MTLAQLQEGLYWCSVINIGILLVWFFMLVFAHSFVYKVHSKWFLVSKEHFFAIHYGLMGYFKLTVFIFNIVPYIVIVLLTT